MVEQYSWSNAADDVWLVKQCGFELNLFDTEDNDTVMGLSTSLGVPESVLVALNIRRYPGLTRTARLMKATQLLVPASDIIQMCERKTFNIKPQRKRVGTDPLLTSSAGSTPRTVGRNTRRPAKNNQFLRSSLFMHSADAEVCLCMGIMDNA